MTKSKYTYWKPLELSHVQESSWHHRESSTGDAVDICPVAV